ncbi:MAG: peptidylprolyl isomerase [Anaerolineales bacterium]|nr:peptidylprolyl isomerase [Anaerolineales bacterium]
MNRRNILSFVWVTVLFIFACQNDAKTPTPPPLLPPNPTPFVPTMSSLQQPILSKTDLTRLIAAGCTAKSPRPTPGPTEVSLFPPVSDSDYQRGSSDARVTFVVYCDFQAQPCAQFAALMEQIMLEFPDEVRWVYRYFPLVEMHDKAILTVQAAEAAARQGKFWQMHDWFYRNYSEWSGLSPEQFENWLWEQADALQLDPIAFQKDFDDPALAEKGYAAWRHNQNIGLPGVPFILLDGQIWPSNLPLNYYTVRNYILLDLLEERQFESCPPPVIDLSKKYLARLETEKGNVVVELFAEKAPITVNNFVFLARQGWYDGITFHRVLENYIVQSGDPSGTGYGGPGYAFVNETSPDLSFDQAGMIAMANAGKDTNGSQFFLTLAPAPHLNGAYTIFGQVIQGMEVLKQISLRDPSQFPPPPPGDKLLSVTILEE